MLHTTGRGGGLLIKPKWLKGLCKRVKAKEKQHKGLQTGRKLILEFAKEYKKVCASKHFDIDERSEHVWLEKWFRSKRLIEIHDWSYYNPNSALLSAILGIVKRNKYSEKGTKIFRQLKNFFIITTLVTYSVGLLNERAA
jgi:hypothetical protein